jgi:uncharacterized membrane protein YfcA
MSALVIATATAAVLVGAVTMRVTGMGFALIAAPFLVLILGPLQGVLVSNTFGTVSAVLNLTQQYRDIDWRRARWLIPTGLIGVLPGAVAVHRLPLPVLAVVVSLIVLVGLALTVLGRRVSVLDSPVVAGISGFSSGLMTVTASVGGPALVVYALATKWQHSRFAATAQLHLGLLGAVSLAQAGALPALPWAGWLALAAALVLGLVAGAALARRIDGARAMRLVIVVAVLGAVLSLVEGIRSL